MTGALGRLVACLVALAPLGCTVGQGTGDVTSQHLYVNDCWNGPFDLKPDFFGANPDNGVSLMIRVQRGDNIEDVSDGLDVLVNDLQDVRSQLKMPIPVGLPPGVSPPGVPITFNPDPPKVSLALYLHNSCHQQDGTIYSISGTITFNSLFSGDLNEGSSENRLTDATFTDVSFADPRELAATSDANAQAALTSLVSGNFNFFFQRGQPSQPFE
ncbi:MAG TPA: hypothetical protein VK745_16255 [Polyangiaceae bacterium]|jgi:hypothetical protein|nr:hypothetical protein [Polyangiaceae bacterium]